MRLENLEPQTPVHVDLAGKRLLIFIVAYNAETTIEKVLRRIPPSLHCRDVEVLIIDDSSKDDTFVSGVRYQKDNSAFKITVLRTPENQGHGGNQKLGYRYAIDHGFDIVALLEGDAQYAPEKLPSLLAPLVRNEADAVFGARKIDKCAVHRDGGWTCKSIGHKILTAFQNWMLRTQLPEFHTGYRLYSTRALAQIPFEKNTDEFHFDNEMAIQFSLKNLRIVEVPVSTSYGDQVRHVNGFKYARNVFRMILRLRFHQMNLLFDRKFDLGRPEHTYDLKLDFPSSHVAAIAAAKPGSRVLDIGCGQGYVSRELARKACHVTGLDRYAPEDLSLDPDIDFICWDLNRPEFPVNVSQFDQVFILDTIEHLKDPENFMDELRFAAACKRPEIILTTANIGFVVTRLMLLFGQFNYGKKGILDATHTRLFTFRSLRELFEQCGYKILEVRGIPAPFPRSIGHNWLSRVLIKLNQVLIRVSKGLFSYQIFVRAEAKPTVNNLLNQTMLGSAHLKRAVLEAA